MSLSGFFGFFGLFGLFESLLEGRKKSANYAKSETPCPQDGAS
jgi:hypothetical protein